MEPGIVKGISTKQKEILAETKSHKINIVKSTVRKKKCNGSEYIKDYIHMYSDVDRACRTKTGLCKSRFIYTSIRG